MAGTYTEGQSKVLSGVYSLIVAALKAVTMGARGVVAYPFTADWGPVNAFSDAVYQPDFVKQYNATNNAMTAYKVNTHAWNGKPSKVKAYRMATNTAAKGTATLNDDAAAVSLTLETLYPSGRAFQAVVKDSVTAGNKVVQIVEGGKLLCQADASTVADLKTQLDLSDYVRVTATGNNMPANNAGLAFAGGANGEAVTATEYSAFLTALEAETGVNAFALDGTTDAAILSSAEDWVQRVRTEGLYITFVRGGEAAWDTDGGAAANAESKALNYRGIVNVGNGVDGFTAAELAIFIAARVAAVPLNATLTDEVTPYMAVNKKLTPSQRETAKLAGTLVFVQKGDQVLIDEGVNTLTAPTIDGEVASMGKIRINNALDQIVSDLESFGDEYKRSRSNTDAARLTFAATVEDTYLKPLVGLEVLQPGYSYVPDPQWHGKNAIYTPKIDEAYFFADITPVDSMERIYQKISVNL